MGHDLVISPIGEIANSCSAADVLGAAMFQPDLGIDARVILLEM